MDGNGMVTSRRTHAHGASVMVKRRLCTVLGELVHADQRLLEVWHEHGVAQGKLDDLTFAVLDVDLGTTVAVDSDTSVCSGHMLTCDAVQGLEVRLAVQEVMGHTTIVYQFVCLGT